MAWIERRRAKDGTATWYVYWREAGRGTAKKSLKAGARRRDAERLAVEIQARVNAGLVGGSVVAKRATLNEFVDKWLPARLVRQTTLRRDKSLINTYLRPAFGGTLLNAVGVEDIKQLLARVAKQRSPSTARRLLAVISKMFGDAVRSDYARQNPVQKLDRRDKPEGRRKAAQAIDLTELLEMLAIWCETRRKVGSRLQIRRLRHGFTSLLLAWGEPILYVSQQLGHSSAGFTLSTYAHLIQEGRKLDKEQTLRKLAGAALGERAPRVPQRDVSKSSRPSESLDKYGAGDRI